MCAVLRACCSRLSSVLKARLQPLCPHLHKMAKGASAGLNQSMSPFKPSCMPSTAAPAVPCMLSGQRGKACGRGLTHAAPGAPERKAAVDRRTNRARAARAGAGAGVPQAQRAQQLPRDQRVQRCVGHLPAAQPPRLPVAHHHLSAARTCAFSGTSSLHASLRLPCLAFQLLITTCVTCMYIGNSQRACNPSCCQHQCVAQEGGS
jgi:hypothetical protein